MDLLPLRQLAIRLACIHAEDRAWVLAQLDSLERQQIDVLLLEISDLGLDKDPAVLAAMHEESTARFAMSSVVQDDVVLHTQVSQLDHPYWGALLLQMYGASPRRKVMDSLPQGALVRRWDHALSEQTVPPALVAALAQYLANEELSHVES